MWERWKDTKSRKLLSYQKSNRRRCGWLAVTCRVGLQPSPGRLNDKIQLLKFRRPTKVPLDGSRTRNQSRRITNSPIRDLNGNQAASDLLRTVNDLFNRISFAAAKIVDGIARSLEGKNVRAREIHYMNVIADASSILGWIIVAV